MERRAIRAGLWWIAALATLWGINAWVGASEAGIPALDRGGLVLAHAWRSPRLDAAFSAITWLGSLALLLPATLALAMLMWRKGHRGESGFVIAALVGAAEMAQLVKHLAPRARPDLFPALASGVSSNSFPSAHSAQVAALAVALLLLVLRHAPWQARWTIPAALATVVLVGLSRVYLQVHYPSDVLAGAIASACWVFGLRECFRAG